MSLSSNGLTELPAFQRLWIPGTHSLLWLSLYALIQQHMLETFQIKKAFGKYNYHICSPDWSSTWRLFCLYNPSEMLCIGIPRHFSHSPLKVMWASSSDSWWTLMDLTSSIVTLNELKDSGLDAANLDANTGNTNLAKILLITPLVLQYFHYMNKLLEVKFPFSLVLLISTLPQNGNNTRNTTKE